MMTTGIAGPDAVPRIDAGTADDSVLERVVVALNSTLELREVLRALAELTLEVSGGHRCSVFVASGGSLRPAVSIGVDTDEELWEAFHEMGAYTMDGEQAAVFRRLRTLPIEDARQGGIIPDAWVRRFDLRGVVLVPLLAAGEPCGLLVVDYPGPHAFTPEELRMLEAISASASVAVRNARLYEAVRRRARLQEALARAAEQLSQPMEPAVIAGRLAAAYTDLLGVHCCAIGRLDVEREEIRALIVSGEGTMAPLSYADIPPHVVAGATQAWSSRPVRALEFGADPFLAGLAGCGEEGAERYLLVPMLAKGRVRGIVLLGFGQGAALEDEARTAAETLANIAAAAIERHELLDELAGQVRQLDVLYRVSSALPEQAESKAVVTRLNELLAESGITVDGLVFRERGLARRLGGGKLRPEEREAWKRGDGCVVLRADDNGGEDGENGGETREADDAGGPAADVLSVPMRLGRRVVGTMRVRPPTLPADQRAFLVTLAGGVADIASRGAMRTALDTAIRDRAVAAERDRIAADLHDTVGQIFVAIGLMARRQVEQMIDGGPLVERVQRLAELADGGKWELEQAIRALAFVPAERRGLLPALRGLAASFESDSGISVLVEPTGKPVRLSAPVERAFYRIANEALTNAWRHARCSFVRLELEFNREDTVLRITDDGVGLTPRLRDRGPGMGIMSMRRAVAAVGGHLRVRNAARHGVRVEARVGRSSS